MLKEQNQLLSLPLLALRGVVMLPKAIIHFEVGREKSVAAVERALKNKQSIFLVAQRDILIEHPEISDLYDYGCVARITQVLRMPDGVIKVLARGEYRARLVKLVNANDYYSGVIEKCTIEPVKSKPVYVQTLLRKIKQQFEELESISNKFPPDVFDLVVSSNDLSTICDVVTANFPIPFDDKQFILEQLNIIKRAKLFLQLLERETKIAKIDKKISEQVKCQIDENQKEYYLREQLKAVSNELYGDDSIEGEIDEYRAKINSLNAKSEVKEKLNNEVSKLVKMPQGSHEATVVRTYLDTCIKLPWDSVTDTNINLQKAEKILERDFYGLKKVKERIIEMLAVYKANPNISGQIICLAGPPGVGKTHIGKTIAECMGRRYARIALGGVHDESEIRGHRKTYLGAMPGRIINAIASAGSSNPLILLDELDKLGSDYKGDPSAALLEVLDKEQNNAFCDHFIDMPYDLSKAVFIATANDVSRIPDALYDRLEIIELSSYTMNEKLNIAKKHLIPKQLKAHSLTTKDVTITADAVLGLINDYTREAGVRQLEREIATLCRKVTYKIQNGTANGKITIKNSNITEFLGNRRFISDIYSTENQVGVINGLAWTGAGGKIMQLEVSALKGTGKVELTGSLGDVMKESAYSAISYVRSCAERYGIDPMFYKDTDLHVHATESAIKKDGPSAGVTITTALISALTGAKVRCNVALTGEVSIKGKVYPIGGLKEKTVAAYKAGIKTVLIPAMNKGDLEEIDEEVKQSLNIILVSTMDDVLKHTLIDFDTVVKEKELYITDTKPTTRPTANC